MHQRTSFGSRVLRDGREHALAFGIAVGALCFGCGGPSAPSTAPYPLPAKSIPSSAPLPPEYRTVAEKVALDIKPAREEFRDNKGMSEILAEGHASVMALQSVPAVDPDLAYIAAQGRDAFREAIDRLERLNALPKPADAGTLFATSFVDGFFGNLHGGYARGVDAEKKQNAINDELTGLIAAIEKADAAQQLLPAVAERFSASFCDSTGRIAVDVDEAWGWFGPNDWVTLHNQGAALEDCTIVVQLTGSAGETRKNVHFVRSWPAQAQLHARYEPGVEVLGRKVAQTTVPGVQQADITIFSPRFATLIRYVYTGAEKDKDVARLCEPIRMSGRYQPLVRGILWNTERGFSVTLDGVAALPKCWSHLTFRKGTEAKTWFWELPSWERGESKVFTTPTGGLVFDPDVIDLTLSFPGTAYRHAVSFKIRQ